MKRAAIIISVVVGLLVLAALAVVMRPPAGMIAARVAAQVKEATGRDLVVKGATSATLGWSLTSRLEDVALANPAGVPGEPLLAARALEIVTPTLPALLGRPAALDTVRLVEPRVALAIDDKGQNNWTFATSGPSTFAARAVEMKGGHLTFLDARNKDALTAEGLDGTARDVSGARIGAFSFTGSRIGGESGGATLALEAPVIAGTSATPDAIATFDLKGTRLALHGLADGLDATLEQPEMHGSGLTTAKLDGLDLKAARIATQLPGGALATFDAIDARATALKPEDIGTLALKAGGARYVVPGEGGKGEGGAAGNGVDIALDGLVADAKALAPEEIGSLVLDAKALRYKLADGAGGGIDSLHAEQRRISPDGIGELALTGAKLTHASAGGTTFALVDIGAKAKALTPKSLGEGTLTAQRLTTGDADARFEVTKAEATTKDARLPGPLEVALGFDWNGERVAGSVKLDALAWPTDDKPAPLGLKLAARGATLALDGTLSAKQEIEGKTTLGVKSVRDVAKWLGVTLPASGPLAAASIEGRVKAAGKRIAFTDAQFALDATKAKGSLALDGSGKRPRLAGKLAADTFDADAYGLTTAPKTAVAAAALETSEAVADAPPPTLKQALKAFVRAEMVRLDAPAGTDAAAAAATARTTPPPPTWSDEPIDLAGLKKADLDLALSVDKLRLAGLDLAVPALAAKLDDGALTLDGKDVAVRGGKVSGRANVDARGAVPRATASLKADNVEARDILETLGLRTLVTGKSNIEANIDGNIASQKKLVESVTGSVKVKMGKGAVVGYDPAEIFTYITGNGGFDPKRRWPFSRLDADMALDKGVSRNTKVVVDTSAAGATSDGVTNLPAREIDYQARLNVPFWFQPIAVRIFGGWSSPKWAADLFDTSRGLALEQVAGLRSLDIKDRELADMIGMLLAKSARAPKPLDPAVAAVLTALKAQAEAP